MSIKIAIKRGDEKPQWVSIEDFKKLLFDEDITTKGMPIAYPDKVKSFFDKSFAHKVSYKSGERHILM